MKKIWILAQPGSSKPLASLQDWCKATKFGVQLWHAEIELQVMKHLFPTVQMVFLGLPLAALELIQAAL